MNERLAVQNSPDQFIGQGTAQYQARLLQANGNTDVLRTNTLLRRDDWERIESTIVDKAQEFLGLIDQLRSRGMVQDVGDLGVLIRRIENISDMGPAEQSMSGVDQSREDRQEYGVDAVPMILTHKGFRVGQRQLLSSRRNGGGLDTAGVAAATGKVNEKIEDTGFAGGPTINGNQVYGLTNHPDRVTGNAVDADGSGGSDWADDIDNVYETIRAMIDDVEAQGTDDEGYQGGPLDLFVNPNQWGELFQTYTDGSGDTAFERVMSKLEARGLQNIIPTAKLSDGELVLVHMTTQVIDLAVGEDIQAIEWQTNGGMTSRFKVMAAVVPTIKSDYDGISGVVHYTGA